MRGLLVPLLQNLEEQPFAETAVAEAAVTSPRRKPQRATPCVSVHERLGALKKEDIVKFFIWLDSIAVSHDVRPTLKEYYGAVARKEKMENFPCLSDEKKKFRLMIAKAVHGDYKTRAVHDLIRFFMRHYEEIVDRIDRCGLGADAYVSEMLGAWREAL